MLNEQQESELEHLVDETLLILDSSLIPDYSPGIRNHLEYFIAYVIQDCRNGIMSVNNGKEVINKLQTFLHHAIELDAPQMENNIHAIKRHLDYKAEKFNWPICVMSLLTSTVIALTFTLMYSYGLSERDKNPVFVVIGLASPLMGIACSFLCTPVALSYTINNKFKKFSNSIYSFLTDMKPASEAKENTSRNYYELAKKIVSLLQQGPNDEKQIISALKPHLLSLYQSDKIAQKDMKEGQFIQRLFDIYVTTASPKETLRRVLEFNNCKDTFAILLRESIIEINKEAEKKPEHHIVEVQDEVQNGYRRLPG